MSRKQGRNQQSQPRHEFSGADELSTEELMAEALLADELADELDSELADEALFNTDAIASLAREAAAMLADKATAEDFTQPETEAVSETALDVADEPLPETPELRRLCEAFLFTQTEPVSAAVLAKKFSQNEAATEEVLQQIIADTAHQGFRLYAIDGKYIFRTAADLAPWLRSGAAPVQVRKPPRVAVETLAIIAYHQPVTRAQISQIRGVDVSRGTLDMLMEQGWIRPGKKLETPGRPVTWITTPDFLQYFGLNSLQDLPGMEELKAAGLLDKKPILASMAVTEDDNTLADKAEHPTDEDQFFAREDELVHDLGEPELSEAVAH